MLNIAQISNDKNIQEEGIEIYDERSGKMA